MSKKEKRNFDHKLTVSFWGARGRTEGHNRNRLNRNVSALRYLNNIMIEICSRYSEERYQVDVVATQ